MADVTREASAVRAGESGGLGTSERTGTSDDGDTGAGTRPDADDHGTASADPSPGSRLQRARRWLTVDRAALGLILVPAIVAVVGQVVVARPDYFPVGDFALTEMQIRDVGRHEVLVGLYSRSNWNHPGPMFFYLLAPIYRLAGSSSIGVDLGALALNVAAIFGMGLVARRRGGTPLLLCTLIGALLMARTLGAGYLADPWNNFVVVFPFALLVLLVWSMACGEIWALLPAVVVTSFLAQTHVGFVPLAGGLFAWGLLGLLVPILRPRRATTGDGVTSAESEEASPDGEASPEGNGDGDDGAELESETGGDGSGDGGGDGSDRRRRLLRASAWSAGVGAVLWAPPAIDVLRYSPNNLRKIYQWFAAADEGTHTLGEGWRTITGQFGSRPEWLVDKLAFEYGSGQTPFAITAPRPVLLLPVLAVGVVLWRQRRRRTGDGRPDRIAADAWQLTLLLAFTLVLAIVAVARTVGPAFDYRLRWTWVPPMVAFVLVTWTLWRLAAERWPGIERRLLTPLALVALVVLAGVQTATWVDGPTPHEPDGPVVEQLMPGIYDVVERDAGQVEVNDPFHAASYYSRGIVLQLERAGFDARVPEERGLLFGRHRILDDDAPVQARLVVAQDRGIAPLEDNPDYELVAEWEWSGAASAHRTFERQKAFLDDLEPGSMTDEEILGELHRLEHLSPPNHAVAAHVAVFLDHSTPPS